MDSARKMGRERKTDARMYMKMKAAPPYSPTI